MPSRMPHGLDHRERAAICDRFRHLRRPCDLRDCLPGRSHRPDEGGSGDRSSDRPRGMRHMIRVLGVMTGTSCDGLDAACLSLNDEFEPAGSRRFPLPAKRSDLQSPHQRPLKVWLELHPIARTGMSKAQLSIGSKTLKPPISQHGQRSSLPAPEKGSPQMETPRSPLNRPHRSFFRDGTWRWRQGTARPFLPCVLRWIGAGSRHTNSESEPHLDRSEPVIAFDRPRKPWMDEPRRSHSARSF